MATAGAVCGCRHRGRGLPLGAHAEPRVPLGAPRAQGLRRSDAVTSTQAPGPACPNLSSTARAVVTQPLGSTFLAVTSLNTGRDKALSLRQVLPGQHQPALQTQGRPLQAPCSGHRAQPPGHTAPSAQSRPQRTLLKKLRARGRWALLNPDSPSLGPGALPPQLSPHPYPPLSPSASRRPGPGDGGPF